MKLLNTFRNLFKTKKQKAEELPYSVKSVDLSELPIEIVGGSFRLKSGIDPVVKLTVKESAKGSKSLLGPKAPITHENYLLQFLNESGEWVTLPWVTRFSFTVDVKGGMPQAEVQFMDFIKYKNLIEV